MTASNIIWLASFPRSGNTWFRILLANLKSGLTQPVHINDGIGAGCEFLSRWCFDNATMLESGLLTADEVERLRPDVCRALAPAAAPNTWVKVHDAWRRTCSGEPAFGWNIGRAAVYLVRDPRDVAVSLAHHNERTVDSTIEFMNSVGGAIGRSPRRQHPQLTQTLGDWSSHVISWLDQRDVPVHVVHYEALKRDTAAAFEQALRFTGEHVARKDVERAVRYSDFTELQAQESVAGFCEGTSDTTPFFRRGEVGTWRDDLTPAQAGRIVDAHRPVMTRLGYLW